VTPEERRNRDRSLNWETGRDFTGFAICIIAAFATPALVVFLLTGNLAPLVVIGLLLSVPIPPYLLCRWQLRRLDRQ
jgi:hypothetical protein